MKRIEFLDCYKTFQGAWRVSQLLDGGEFFTTQFFGYSKQEAIRVAREQAKEYLEKTDVFVCQ